MLVTATEILLRRSIVIHRLRAEDRFSTCNRMSLDKLNTFRTHREISMPDLTLKIPVMVAGLVAVLCELRFGLSVNIGVLLCVG